MRDRVHFPLEAQRAPHVHVLPAGLQVRLGGLDGHAEPLVRQDAEAQPQLHGARSER